MSAEHHDQQVNPKYFFYERGRFLALPITGKVIWEEPVKRQLTYENTKGQRVQLGLVSLNPNAFVPDLSMAWADVNEQGDLVVHIGQLRSLVVDPTNQRGDEMKLIESKIKAVKR